MYVSGKEGSSAAAETGTGTGTGAGAVQELKLGVQQRLEPELQLQQRLMHLRHMYQAGVGASVTFCNVFYPLIRQVLRGSWMCGSSGIRVCGMSAKPLQPGAQQGHWAV